MFKFTWFLFVFNTIQSGNREVRELETQTDVIEDRPLTNFIGMGEKHILGYK